MIYIYKYALGRIIGHDCKYTQRIEPKTRAVAFCSGAMCHANTHYVVERSEVHRNDKHTQCSGTHSFTLYFFNLNVSKNVGLMVGQHM